MGLVSLKALGWKRSDQFTIACRRTFRTAPANGRFYRLRFAPVPLLVQPPARLSPSDSYPIWETFSRYFKSSSIALPSVVAS
jgi:hypothetical protein